MRTYAPNPHTDPLREGGLTPYVDYSFLRRLVGLAALEGLQCLTAHDGLHAVEDAAALEGAHVDR